MSALVTAGKFGVTATGLKIRGTPTFAEWKQAGQVLSAVRSGIQWAIGDWLLHADSRKWDADQVEAVLSDLNYKRGTLYNYKSVARAFPPITRAPDMSFTYHQIVASLGSDDALRLLAEAKETKLGHEEMTQLARTTRAARRRAEQAWPTGTFGVMLSDCPWQYEVGTAPPDREIENHYPTLSTDQLCALAPKVQAITAPDCVHYMWTTSPKLPEALDVLRAWGFSYRTTAVWVKDLMGLGYWFRQRHELLLVGVRGTPATPAEDLRPDSVFTAPRREHSRKPDEVYAMIERCYPPVPKVELFARRERDYWTTWGNEVIETPAVRAITVRETDLAVSV